MSGSSVPTTSVLSPMRTSTRKETAGSSSRSCRPSPRSISGGRWTPPTPRATKGSRGTRSGSRALCFRRPRPWGRAQWGRGPSGGGGGWPSPVSQAPESLEMPRVATRSPENPCPRAWYLLAGLRDGVACDSSSFLDPSVLLVVRASAGPPKANVACPCLL
eukprot:Amastigsp_a342293_15.p2 type:complete len:161 gc:universal Amastigsp_a342293_15:647-1129(+)